MAPYDGIDPIETPNDALGNDPLDDFVQEAINEANEDAIKDAIAEALNEEGINPTTQRVDDGYDLITKNQETTVKIIENPEFTLEQKVGSVEKNSGFHQKDDTPKDNEFRHWVAQSRGDLNKRETNEAAAEGLKIYVEQEKEILAKLEKKYEQDTTEALRQDIFYHKWEIDKVETKIKQLEEESAKLPVRKEPDTKNASEFMQEVYALEESARGAKKAFIQDMHSTGIEMNGKFGTAVPGEIFEEQGRIIEEAKNKSEEAFG